MVRWVWPGTWRDKFPSRRIKTIPGWIQAHTDVDDETPALQNDKVLKIIMFHLPQKYLLKCRLVCKAWSAPASTEIAKSSLAYFDQEDVSDEHIGMQPFILTMTNMKTPLISRVQLVDLDLSLDVVIMFFQVYGKYIKELRIEITSPSRSRPESRTWSALKDKRKMKTIQTQKTDVGITDIRNILLFCLPNLEYLELMSAPATLSKAAIFSDWYIYRLTKNISSVSLNEGKASSSVQGINPAIRDRICNLKRLRIKPSEGSRPLQWQIINDLIWASNNLQEIHLTPSVKTMPILNILEQLGRFSQLKTLVVGQLQIPEFQILIKAGTKYGLALKHFQTASPTLEDRTRDDFNYYKDLLDKFLLSQKESLKVLRFQEDPEFPMKLDLPILPKLKELKLAPALSSVPRFMLAFPILKTLSLTGLDPELETTIWESMFPPITQHNYFSTVTQLELPVGLGNVVRLQSIVKYFPNVTELTMTGISEPAILTSLWKAWPELEFLTLELVTDFVEHTDRIFTGLTLEVLEELDTIDKMSAKAQKLARVPSIANLQTLRYLEIRLDGRLKLKPYSFTEISCYFGFMAMYSLKTLLLPHSKISKKCKNQMRSIKYDRLDLDHIYSGSRWWNN